MSRFSRTCSDNISRYGNGSFAILNEYATHRCQVVKMQKKLARVFLVDDGEKLENMIFSVRLMDIKGNSGESRSGWNFLKDE